ncbi:hypothetical protein GCM10027589_54950 [Actinocorallia lasiicapitis]
MKRLLAIGAAAALAGVAGPASADALTARGEGGQTLTVSSAKLKDGDTVTVTGAGFDPAKGVYVALCKDLGPGQAPTPCGGGADTTGQTGGSQWVSSNPPPYGKDLAIAYGDGGVFSVKLSVKAEIGEGLNCAKVKCAIVTKADHTRGSDRSLDVRVPVAFDSGSDRTIVYGGVAAAVVGLGLVGFAVLRRGEPAAESKEAPE